MSIPPSPSPPTGKVLLLSFCAKIQGAKVTGLFQREAIYFCFFLPMSNVEYR